jgi:hypothetical protein
VHDLAGRRPADDQTPASLGVDFEDDSDRFAVNDAAPRASRGLVIGLNTDGTTARPGRNPDDWILLLAGPQVQSVSFTAPGPTSPNSTTEVIGEGQFKKGLAVADIGQVTGPAEVDQLKSAVTTCSLTR